MANMEQIWAYTRTYMESGRTNPEPTSFVADLNSVGLTVSEMNWLKQKVASWPGGSQPGTNQIIINATLDDLRHVQTH